MICVPLQAKTQKELLTLARKAKKNGAQALEIWLDFLAEPVNLKSIRKLGIPIICVNKPRREKGEFRGSEKTRIEILQKAAQAGADYIDIGIDTKPLLIKSLAAKITAQNPASAKSKLILSYHNFKNTPPLPALKKIFQKMARYSPALYKFALTPKNPKDMMRIFAFLKFLFDRKVEYTVIGMGRYGEFAREISEALGNKFTYMALDDHHRTARGQLTLK